MPLAGAPVVDEEVGEDVEVVEDVDVIGEAGAPTGLEDIEARKYNLPGAVSSIISLPCGWPKRYLK